MPPMFLEFTPSNGGDLFLSSTKVLVSWAFGESFFSGKDLIFKSDP